MPGIGSWILVLCHHTSYLACPDVGDANRYTQRRKSEDDAKFILIHILNTRLMAHRPCPPPFLGSCLGLDPGSWYSATTRLTFPALTLVMPIAIHKEEKARDKCELGSLNGVDQEVEYGDDLVLIQVVKGLSAQMRASPILGFPNISLATVSSRSGSLVGQGSTCNRVCGREYPSVARVCPRRCNGCGFKRYSRASLEYPERDPFGLCEELERPLFWVDEFVVLANAQFNWFSGSNVSKDRAPVASEYNVEHAAILIIHASPFLRFPEEFLCWVGISRNYLLNKDTYPRFKYESGEEMDLNAFIRTANPRKVKIVERARAENEEPIMTVAKHRTVTPLLTSVVHPSGHLSESVEREFGEDVSGSAGRGQEDVSVGGYSDAEPIVPVTAGVAAETGSSRAKRPKKKRVAYESGDTPAATHPPKRLRAIYGNTSGSVIGGKSPGLLNRLLRASQLTVEQGVAAPPILPFITSSVTALPLEEGGGHTDSETVSALRTVGPSERFVVLSDSSHYSSAKSADAEVDS
ncbi:hypothetical protein Tco_0128952, partial [Tanacetum coccineum]